VQEHAGEGGESQPGCKRVWSSWCWSRDETAPLTHCRDNNLLGVVSIFTNILLVPLMCIMVTTHNEMCICRTLSHKTTHICGYYKWQTYYNEVSCILNRLAGTSSMVVEASGRRLDQLWRINVAIISGSNSRKRILTDHIKNHQWYSTSHCQVDTWPSAVTYHCRFIDWTSSDI
jgi:hypothetical protein